MVRERGVDGPMGVGTKCEDCWITGECHQRQRHRGDSEDPSKAAQPADITWAVITP